MLEYYDYFLHDIKVDFMLWNAWYSSYWMPALC